MGKRLAFVGSNLAVAIGSSASVVGTITGCSLLKRGDTVVVNPHTLFGSMGYAQVCVPSNGLLNITFINSAPVNGTIAAKGWDVLAWRKA